MSNPLKPKSKKRGRAVGSQNLTKVDGVIRAMIATIRAVKAGKMEHKEGRSLIWMYAQLRDTLAIGLLEKRLENLEEVYQITPERSDPQRLHS